MSQGLSNISQNEALVVDDSTTPNTVYIGYAEIGSATSAAVWKIKKIATATGAVITWADGDDQYDNIWDNRVSLTYL